MPFGKIGVLVLAVAIAIGLGGFGAALKSWVGGDPVAAITLSDVDARKDDADGPALADDGDQGDGDKTRGNDGTSGGNNTGDGDRTRGNDGTSGGNNTGDGDRTRGNDGTAGGDNTVFTATGGDASGGTGGGASAT
jgi:hypothetical protein